MKRPWNLSACFGLILGLVAAAPVLATSSGWIGPQLVALAVAAMLVLLNAAPKADIQSGCRILKPLAIAACLPAVWMMFQIIPVSSGTAEHPIWRSAAAALNEPLAGHVSIDLGYTLRGLFTYLNLAALTFVTAILARDRKRAETLFFSLCGITTLVAIELIMFRDSAVIKTADNLYGFTGGLVALAAFGIILNLAFIVRGEEIFRTRGSDGLSMLQGRAGIIAIGAAGAVVCLVAVASAASINVIIAIVFGVTILGLVVALRRLNLGRWSVATICAVAFVACSGVVALRFSANPAASPFFRFTSPDIANASAVTTLRMMSDASWVGGGVGSFQSLAAIYSDTSGSSLQQSAPNTAISMVLEWGRGGLFIVILLAAQLLIMLFRGALTRGRNSYFPSAAAACLIVIFGESYCDASFAVLTVQVIAAIIFGLGLSQTVGRQNA